MMALLAYVPKITIVKTYIDTMVYVFPPPKNQNCFRIGCLSSSSTPTSTSAFEFKKLVRK